MLILDVPTLEWLIRGMACMIHSSVYNAVSAFTLDERSITNSQPTMSMRLFSTDFPFIS